MLLQRSTQKHTNKNILNEISGGRQENWKARSCYGTGRRWRC
jgi:hypothetical protein